MSELTLREWGDKYILDEFDQMVGKTVVSCTDLAFTTTIIISFNDGTFLIYNDEEREISYFRLWWAKEFVALGLVTPEEFGRWEADDQRSREQKTLKHLESKLQSIFADQKRIEESINKIKGEEL